jgi:hypothetical protein
MRTSYIKQVLFTVSFLAVASVQAQNPNTEVDAIMQKVKPRSEVLDSANDLTLQVVLPPQYSQCMHAAFSEAGQQNNVAHRFLLEQIDFLVGAGLTPASISSIIAYGHAITNTTFASQIGKSVDKLQGNDFKERQKYIYQVFARLSCVNTFSDERIQPALKGLIASTRQQSTR